MILNRGSQSKPTLRTSNTVLAARTTEGRTNPGCKAKKRATHTTNNCYWPGGGKEGQFPPNFSQRTRANAANAISKVSEHFVLSTSVKNMVTEVVDRAWPQGQNMPCAPTDHLMPNLDRGLLNTQPGEVKA
jgi:hypothetical protein